jgi:tRNA-dihydrouridine synthase 3
MSRNRGVGASHPTHPSLDLTTTCPVFTETGECRCVRCSFCSICIPNLNGSYGFKCRFLGGHVHTDETGNIALAGDEDKKARAVLTANELNFISSDIRNALRTKKVES